jgi:polyhydroxyalkanoate synthesis regulator phasin
MGDQAELEELIEHLVRSSRLDRAEAARLVDEVLAFLHESAGEFVRRRHRELQQAGHSNDEIFARIGAETARRRFRAPLYSERQIRRLVYG